MDKKKQPTRLSEGLHKIAVDDGADTVRISAVANKLFNPKIDYEIILSKLREEFNKNWEISTPSPENGLEDFEELAILGAGSFGKVKLVKEKANPTKYFAAKVMLKDQIIKTKQVTHVFNEKKVLACLRFPFVLYLEFSRKDNDSIVLGLPFINGGELFTYHRKVRKFNEKQARFYAAQVLLALEYMHYVHLLYRDLKPENILIDNKGYLKVTDFGFAKYMEQKVETRTLTLCGTPEYLAPEIIQSKPYGTSVDWWSFGILVYEFVAGYSPFSPHNRDVMAMYAKICECEYKMPAYFSSALKDLVNNLLQVDLSKRFGNLTHGIKDIKDHEWLKAIDWYALLNQEIPPPFVPAIKDMEDLSHFDQYPNTRPFQPAKVNKHAEIFQDF